jgi:hypothetical protein
MEPDAIEVLLRALHATLWGWQAELPGAAFLGRQVGLQIDTRSVPGDGPPPMPDAAEVGLARLVLGGLPEVLAEAERQYRAYHAGAPAAVERAHEPCVWLSRAALARDGPDRWAVVVGIAGAEDYGTHVEFAGLSCVGAWSGD